MEGGSICHFWRGILGTVLLVPLMLSQRFFSKRGPQSSSEQELQWGAEVPFGPYLAIAGMVYFGGASSFIDPWFDPILWFFHNTSLL